jgi:hypothetical protein
VVQFVESNVKKKTATKKIDGKKQEVGFYSSIGCKGKRKLQVTFVSESGQKTPKSKNLKC